MDMREKSFQVFGLGQCCLDYIGKIESYPPPDEKCEFYDMIIQGGGPVATALVALSRWGISCAFSGVIGDDLFGPTIKSSLDREEIDTSGLLIRRGFHSQFAFIAAEPGMGRRTIFWQRPTGSPPSPDEVDTGLLKRAEVFHTDGLFSDASLAAAREARKAGVRIVVDAGSLHEGMLELARTSDYFIASETLALELVGDNNPLKACRELSELGPHLVGVTLGARGYVALVDGRVIREPAYPVDAVDTTGCGDIFHGGFIFGLIRGWNVEKSLDFASWSAAMVSRKMGGRAGIPSLEELRAQGYS